MKFYIGDIDLGWWRCASTGHPVIKENEEPQPPGPAPHSASQSTKATPEASTEVGEPRPLGPDPRPAQQLAEEAPKALREIG